jgi:hypothetical protein
MPEQAPYQRPASKFDVIDLEAFQVVERQRLPRETTPFLIESALNGLGITLGQLGRLLGTSSVHCSAWRNGRKRLSAAYSGRLLALGSLHNEGLPLNLAHHVRWEDGSIEWLNGNISKGNHRLAKGWVSTLEPTRRPVATKLLNWNTGPGINREPTD